MSDLLIYCGSTKSLKSVLNIIKTDSLSSNIIFEFCLRIEDDFNEKYYDNNYTYVFIYEIIRELLDKGYNQNIREACNILIDLYNYQYKDKYYQYHNEDVLKAINLLSMWIDR